MPANTRQGKAAGQDRTVSSGLRKRATRVLLLADPGVLLEDTSLYSSFQETEAD